MKIFRLSCGVTVSAQTVVSAETLEQAAKIARAREVVITTGRDGADESSQWLIEDADGEPQDIHES